VLLSGGIDSATCLYFSRRKGYRNHALTMLFHRIADGEVSSAKAIALAAGVVEHRIVRLPDLMEVGEMMEVRETFVGLPPTYIPSRNMIFYGLAASFAEEIGADYIMGGHNKDDTQIFEDTRRDFFTSLQETIWNSSNRIRKKRTTVLRPLQHMTKPEVISLAAKLEVPLELTWSCHEEGSSPCFKCEGCIKRREAFAKTGVSDPLSTDSAKIRGNG
jgi:7-cyano-7-deazaguanine synthase